MGRLYRTGISQKTCHKTFISKLSGIEAMDFLLCFDCPIF
jgi:hypothetical protein